MKNYAVVNPDGGIVSNVVVGDSLEETTLVVGSCVEVNEFTGPAIIGYLWNGKEFIQNVSQE